MRKSSWLVAGVAVAAIWAGLLLAAEAPAPKTVEPAAPLLAAFAKSVAALDAQKMGALFLPPDDSANGRNRKKHIDEMRRDWERVRERGKKVAVSFAETRTVVRTTMVLKEGASPAQAVPIELEVVATDAGWRIAAMRYLARSAGGQ